MMRNYSDSEILKGILEGSSDVLSWIYHTNFRSVRKYIKDNNGNDDDADDVFQEAIMIVYRKIQNSDLVLSASFSTYLFSVAKYIWFNELRRKKITGVVTNEPDEFYGFYDDIADIQIKVERDKLMRKHFNSLPSLCKKLLTYVFEGLALSEITKKLNYNSEQYTKNRRFKCKTILYKKITNDPKFKELKNEQYREDNNVPRW
jgi:RNA polymerase sigma factor (sigma-70 family)